MSQFYAGLTILFPDDRFNFTSGDMYYPNRNFNRYFNADCGTFFLKVKMLLKLASWGEGPPAQIDVDSNLGNAQNKGCFFLGSLPFDVTPRNTRFMSFLPTALIDS